jgi:phosphatidate phosphatase LPIN
MALPMAINSTDRRQHEQGHELQVGGIGRSRSVPPNYLGSPARKSRRGSRDYREYEDVGEHNQEDEEERGRDRPWNEKVQEDAATKREGESESKDEASAFGTGGTLSASRDDLTMLVLSIEGRKVGFQLSLIPPEGEEEDSFTQDEERGRQGIANPGTKKQAQNEVEAARLFDRYCIDWTRFLDDETVVHDQRLIIRWAGNQFVLLLLTTTETFDGIPHAGISRGRTARH